MYTDEEATNLQQALEANRALRERLDRTSRHLALLSDINHRLTAASSLDEILDTAPILPQRLVPSHTTALVLADAGALVLARTGGDRAILAQSNYEQAISKSHARTPQLVAEALGSRIDVPLHDGQALVGWLVLWRAETDALPDDELDLLATMAAEIAEAISGARRRAREARAIYALERAIAEERARIARDIHDGLAQTLAFQQMRITLWLDWLENNPDRLREEFAQFKLSLRDQIAELRRAIFALRPIPFDELGFEAGLRRYIAEFAAQQRWQSSITIAPMPFVLTPDIEATCFRIIQEGLTNAAKHASATEIVVAITAEKADDLRIEVRDNGQGFSTAEHAAEQTGRVGLRQMRERLHAIGGRLDVLSQLGQGTRLIAHLPAQVGPTSG